MTLLSTYIKKEINTVLSEYTLLNDKAREEKVEALTHEVIQIARNKVTAPFIHSPEVTKILRRVIK